MAIVPTGAPIGYAERRDELKGEDGKTYEDKFRQRSSDHAVGTEVGEYEFAVEWGVCCLYTGSGHAVIMVELNDAADLEHSDTTARLSSKLCSQAQGTQPAP